MNDLISRQMAIDALEKEKPTPFVNKDGSIDPFGAGRQNQWYRDGIAIMNLPSAQPERKKGKWIDAWRSAFDGTRHWHRECSECGYERDDDSIDKDTRFCPNCGAEMQKGEEDE